MHPILIDFGHPFSVKSYGFMLALGFFIGIHLSMRHAKREGIDPNKILNLTFIIFLVSIAGSRLLHVFVEDFYKYWNEPLKVFYLWDGGYAFYGGYILAVLSVLFFAIKEKYSFWHLTDVLSPFVAIGLAYGRMGCFLAGCCFGEPCTLPWAIKFPHESLGRAGLFLHPTQNYSSIYAILIFVVLILIRRYKRFHGYIFLLFLILYSIARSAVEFLRDDHRGEFFNDMISTSQLISIPIIIFAIVMFVYFYIKRGKQTSL